MSFLAAKKKTYGLFLCLRYFDIFRGGIEAKTPLGTIFAVVENWKMDPHYGAEARAV